MRRAFAGRRNVPARSPGRFDGGKSQLQPQVEQLDVGYRDDQVAAENDARIEQPIEQFQEGVFFVFGGGDASFHGNGGVGDRIGGQGSTLGIRCPAIDLSPAPCFCFFSRFAGSQSCGCWYACELPADGRPPCNNFVEDDQSREL